MPKPSASERARMESRGFNAEELLAPVQRKRKRTGKACASCRRRKTRCTGGIPCDACRIGEMTCSYDDPDRRMTAIEYIQSLERKVEELEGLLNDHGHRTIKDSSTPSTSPGAANDHPRSVRFSSARPPSTSNPSTVPAAPSPGSSANGDDEDFIETMIRSQNSHENTSLHGHRGSFAGLSLLQRMHNLCRHVYASQKQPDAEVQQDDFISAFDFASTDSESAVPTEAFTLLPPKSTFDRAVDVVMNEACCIMQFLDRAKLEKLAADVYSETYSATPQESRKSFGLMYAVLALGRRFDPTSPGESSNPHMMRGLRYFRASRTLLDPANCRDLTSLQALLCMILYTQVSSMISTCYSYICMGVAAALQMGLFTEAASKDLTEAEKLHRRRIYSVLNIMDTYVTTALGLPRTLRDVESDFVLPLPIKPESMRYPLAGTYAHAKLIQILALAVDANHPVTRPISEKNGFYGVGYSKITATEEQLEAWFANLPQDPVMDAEDPVYIRSQLHLRLAYAHVQLVLYRPFLHHALRNIPRDTPTSFKAYACGSACIKAAMQVVWLAETLEAYHSFSEAHWFTTLIISTCAACLVLFVVSNENDPTLQETEAAVKRIKSLCLRHADHNASMQRCFNFIEAVHPDNPEPPVEIGTAFDEWNSEVSHTFTEAYRLPHDAGLETHERHGEDVLQALSLPQFRSFLNNRI